MALVVVTIGHGIFKLPLILTIGYDLLMTTIILATAPISHAHGYGFVFHIATIWSIIYIVRNLVQPLLNPIYYLTFMVILIDQTQIAMHDIEYHLVRAVY